MPAPVAGTHDPVVCDNSTHPEALPTDRDKGQSCARSSALHPGPLSVGAQTVPRHESTPQHLLWTDRGSSRAGYSGGPRPSPRFTKSCRVRCRLESRPRDQLPGRWWRSPRSAPSWQTIWPGAMQHRCTSCPRVTKLLLFGFVHATGETTRKATGSPNVDTRHPTQAPLNTY